MNLDKFFGKFEKLLNDFFPDEKFVNETYSKKISNSEHDVEVNWSNTRGKDGNVILFDGIQLANVVSETDLTTSYESLIYNDNGLVYFAETGEVIDHSLINWVINYKVDVKK